MCITHALLQMCGVGLEVFASAKSLASMASYKISSKTRLNLDPWIGKWGILGFTIDQHSVGWCAVNYLKYGLRLLVSPLLDVFHRVWNDIKLALGRAGWWEAVLLSTIWININYGSYEGSKWWREATAAAEEYFAHHGSAQCPLFLLLLLSMDLMDLMNAHRALWSPIETFECFGE